MLGALANMQQTLAKEQFEFILKQFNEWADLMLELSDPMYNQREAFMIINMKKDE